VLPDNMLYAWMLTVVVLLFAPRSFGQAGEDSSAPAPVAAAVKPLSLFDYPKIVSVGLSLSSFHYNEFFDLNDDRREFYSRYGRYPVIQGAPKSTEQGNDLGAFASLSLYSWRDRLLFRPKAALILGMGNDYDGSLQGQLIDSSTILFVPFAGKKNNIFLFAGGDIGYAFPHSKYPFVIYSGLDFKLWYRDVLVTREDMYYPINASNTETYIWFSLPLGVLVTMPFSPDVVAGLDARVNLMFYGTMQVSENTGNSAESVDFPSVKLGNRASFGLELFAEQKANDNVAIKYCPYLLLYWFGKSNSDVSTITVQADNGPVEYPQTFFEPPSRSLLIGFAVSMEFFSKRF
jgi:hypothetical protein